MPIDFRASQIQTNKIIASGSTGTATGAQIVVYSHLADNSISPNQGFIDKTVFVTSSIGTDIFLYVSGGIGEKDVGGSQAISVFGGDLHVSGNLTVDGTYPSGGGGGNDYWVSTTPDDIRTTGSIYIDAGAYNGNLIEFDNSGSGATIRVADSVVGGVGPGDLDMFIRAGSDFSNGGTSGGTTWIYAGDGAEKVPGGAASGGDVVVNAGNGGDGASAFPGPKDGGNGGTILIQGGSGGTGVNVGGDGGSVIIGAGSGNIDISGSGDGGGGGSVSLAAGTGASATNTAGAGGIFQIVAGDGGDGFDGASGGAISIYAGAGGDGFGGAAAVGGSIQIVAGSPGFDNFNNTPTGSGPIVIAGGLHSEVFHYDSGSNMSVGVPFGFGMTFNFTRIFFNRSADPDYAAINGLPLPTDISDVFFFVSGNIGGKDGSIPTVALFGGDVVISGVLHGGSPLKIGSSILQNPNNNSIDTGNSSDYNVIFASDTNTYITGVNAERNVILGSSTVGIEAEINYANRNAILSSDTVSITTNGNDANFNSINASNGVYIDGSGASSINSGFFVFVQSASYNNSINSSLAIIATSASLVNGTLAAGDATNLFSPTISVIENSWGSAIIAGGPNFISSSDGNPIINSAIIGSNWVITSSRTYAIGDTVNPATVLISASNGVSITGDTNVVGNFTVNGSPVGGGLATGKQYLASATTTTTTTPLMIGQFSWVPTDYTGLTSVRVRAIMSTDGTANHTGSLQIFNLTSGSYLDLVNTPSTGKHFTVTGSTPTLVTSSNLLTGITNFDNSSTSVYEVRVSGSTANNTIIGGVELIFS